MYGEGRGVPQDVAKAVKWYRKAAASGKLAAAQYDLEPSMYDEGTGRAPRTLRRLWSGCESQPNRDLQMPRTIFGVMYGESVEVCPRKIRSRPWSCTAKPPIRKLAIAQYNLGVMYIYGAGVPLDDAKAVEWFRDAAKQGFAEAQNHLGLMYGEGRGVPH